MIDLFQEIWESIRSKKLRVILTGFSIGWGIFMLIILLGSGRGLQNSFEYAFSSQAINKIVVWGGNVSIPFKGSSIGKSINFNNSDYLEATKYIPFVRMTLPEFFPEITSITHKDKTVNYRVKGITDDFAGNGEKYDMLSGRFFNQKDLANREKYIIVSQKAEKELMGSNNDNIGKLIMLNNIPFKLVGVYKDREANFGRPSIYIPFTTSQYLFGGINEVTVITFILKDDLALPTEMVESSIVKYLASRKVFNPKDKKAVRYWNTMANFSDTMRIFSGINLFVWIIGIGTLVAGIVGISNIMIIVVNEKTKEIGIRKALGAKNFSIMKLVILEAFFITSIFGYLGLIFGTIILEIVANIMGNSDFFREPNVDINIALSATILLIVIGCVAGFFPALRASRIKPVEAMRYE